jgi:hypothetical protein
MYHFVEEKIKESIKNGEFEQLPGMGKPLDFTDDLPGMPRELKVGYRLLKNAGYIPENLKEKNGSISFKDLLSCATEGGIEQKQLQKRMEFHEAVRDKKWYNNRAFSIYIDKIYKKLFQ